MADTIPATGEAPKCDEEGCEAEATFGFRWDWGATGKVCADHATLLQQKSQSLNRGIVLHPLQPAAPAPLTRDEKTQLVARTIVLEQEVDAAKAAGLDHYRRNQDLQVQLNAALLGQRELKAQVEDGRARLTEQTNLADALSRENGELLLEVERLRHLETLVADRDAEQRSELGLGPNVVDG